MQITLDKSGKAVSALVLHPSGEDKYDQSVLDFVLASHSFSQLPKGLSELEVFLTFMSNAKVNLIIFDKANLDNGQKLILHGIIHAGPEPGAAGESTPDAADGCGMPVTPPSRPYPLAPQHPQPPPRAPYPPPPKPPPPSQTKGFWHPKPDGNV